VPPEWHTGVNLNVLTIVLLSVVTLIATVVTDLGLINAVGGGSVATIICLVFPALMYQKTIKDLGNQANQGHHREVFLALALMTFGCILGLFGSLKALS
jgi:hypothetical protein